MSDTVKGEPESWRVRAADEGLRIEAFVERRLPEVGREHVAKLVRQGRVLVDDLPAARGETLAVGSEVSIAARSGERAPPLPNRKLPLRVLHEDPDLVAVVKHPGLVMHPGPGHGSDTLLNALVARFPELVELGEEREYGLVHRLDQETSGLVVVARSAAAYEALVRAFSEREVSKEYLALVAGRPPEPGGELEEPVAGKEARTRYELLETAGPVSMLRLRPLTGRTHQVRIHLQGLGCPVLGDARYGHGRDTTTARLYLPRLALHAHRLELEHPTGAGRLVWEDPLPKDLRRAWARARKLWG